ncbi:SNF1-interacting protein [Diatrype stigma]|uniref:SNF1-interacting protein n=1 Tax=Diatrype stigma TaxID=117547 RepID=A0AAN9UYK3_9PEZI
MADNGPGEQPAATAATAPPTKASSGISIPVGLSEAKLDSPSFRANAQHFAEQVDIIEKWLDGYAKTSAKLAHDMSGLEETINTYLSRLAPPPIVTSLDHDYTALALKRLGEGSREWWVSVLNTSRKIDSLSVEPIRNFLHGDLRSFKETKRTLEHAQKAFDNALARYLGQSKTKEPSALREDAFSVFETRKAYLKASMDFCQTAPQLRLTLDKLLIRVSTDVWRELKRSKDGTGSFAKYGHEMDRVRGWTKDMELAEPSFKRELHTVRREIAENALSSFRPSRELDDYSASTVPFLGSRGPMNVATDDKSTAKSEKQGWLCMRTIAGKPARHTWIRRWYYCRDGRFGWLINGPQGVLQGDEIGVLLCNAKPFVAEERRFCFEIKTKVHTLLLQAETQAELMEWLEVFEVAKKRAFEASLGREASSLPGGVDPAFSVTPPTLPEFSAVSLDAQAGLAADDGAGGNERSGTLAVPGAESSLLPKPSFELNTIPPKRSATSTLVREEGESGREHAARIMQKLDLHRKATFASGTDFSSMPVSPAPPTGGIASLISASHSLLPMYPPPVPSQATSSKTLGPELQPGTLGPLTLAKPPAATSLSMTAVVYSSERALAADPTTAMPTAILANYWGSNVWNSVHRSSRTDLNPDDPFGPNSPTIKMIREGGELKSPSSTHKKSISMDANVVPQPQERPSQEIFPANYPIELKTNAAQFRLLFPGVPLDEKLVLVFRASWTSTAEGKPDSQPLAGNGRIYVTSEGNMYFYGHQLGLVTTYAFNLDRITEVTAAPGKDCDFIFLHLAQDDENPFNRITIKTFLENLDLLHARLNLLIDDLQAEEPMDIQELIQTFISLEKDVFSTRRSPSVDSWEEVSASEHQDHGTSSRAVSPRPHELRGSQKHRPKFRLPTHPVLYEPGDMQRRDAERNFEISAKACFHVLFGDKSFVFPKLYFDRRATQITQGPWTRIDDRMQRVFRFNVDFKKRLIGQSKNEGVTDYQVIETFEDHVTYVVSHVKTLWHLPHADTFKVVTKIVITHVGKSKCKLALFNKIVWDKAPTIGKRIIERQARDDAENDAEELAEIATDQVRKLGAHSRTKRAIQIYGNVGQQTQVLTFTPGDTDTEKKARINPRTLGSMIIDVIRSFTESVASSLVMFAFAGLKKLWGVVSAERILLALLGFSVLTNIVFSSQGSSAWWSERRAANFMSRVGVGPNVMMSKAIYLTDLEEAARGPSSPLTQDGLHDNSYCYTTFQAIANATDMDALYDDGSSNSAVSPLLMSPTSRATARRLRNTRQKLGTYRHDLLVAMRLVNTVEREMVRSEWENWLLDENLRCDQVGDVLARASSSSSNSVTASSTAAAVGNNQGEAAAAAQKILGGEDGKGGKEEQRRENLRAWFHEYCGSCREDRDAVLGSREQWSLA